jgi:hypothetical protein
MAGTFTTFGLNNIRNLNTTIPKTGVFQLRSIRGQIAYPTINAPPTSKNLCFSIRTLISSYTGPVFKLRRQSDNALQDFYTDTFQTYLTTSPNNSGTSLNIWSSNNICYLHTWYNQVGNGNNAINTNNLTQPTIVKINDKYIIKFDNIIRDSKLTISTEIKISAVFCHFYTTSTNYGAILSGTYYHVAFGRASGTKLTGDDSYDQSVMYDWSSAYFDNGTNSLNYNNGVSSLTLNLNNWNIISLYAANNTAYVDLHYGVDLTTIGFDITYLDEPGINNFTKYETLSSGKIYNGAANLEYYGDKTSSLRGYMTEIFTYNTGIPKILATDAIGYYQNTLFNYNINDISSIVSIVEGGTTKTFGTTGNIIHYSFTNSVTNNNTITFQQDLNVMILIVGGGGGGTLFSNAGGKGSGGGGGFIYYNDNYLFKKGTYNVNIGTGGGVWIYGQDGTPSTITSNNNTILSARGGGGGVSYSISMQSQVYIGGSSGSTIIMNNTSNTNTYSGGYGEQRGGYSGNASANPAGASAVKSSGNTYVGADGFTTTITGTPMTVAGGGGGGPNVEVGHVRTPGLGADNFGGGGNGAYFTYYYSPYPQEPATNGKNGVVIIARYITPPNILNSSIYSIIENGLSKDLITNGSVNYYIFTNTANTNNKINFITTTTAKLLIVGGGGNSGFTSSTSPGAGAGHVYYNNKYEFTPGIYTIKVGSANNSSTLTTPNNSVITAASGFPADTTTVGGNSGSTIITDGVSVTTTYFGGIGVSSPSIRGGGGAGAGGNGTGSTTFLGGSGYVSSITGTSTVYSKGGDTTAANNVGIYGSGGQGTINGVQGCVIIALS